jgi:hypothetical protein
MNKISKDLVKIAKSITAASYDLYYIVDQKAAADYEVFYVGIEADIKNNHYGYLSEQVKDMERFFNRKFNAMKEEFKKTDFAKDVRGPEIPINVFQITNKQTINGVTTLFIEVDYRETGLEYTWDATIDILKKYGFKSRR